MKIKSIFKDGCSSLQCWTILTILLLIGILHYVVYNYQTEIAEIRNSQIERRMKSIGWLDIEGVLNMSLSAAKVSAKETSADIINRINCDYEDKDVLRREFESGNYNSPKFTNLIIEEIKGKYLFDIQTHENDVFVVSKNGIIADLNVDNFASVRRPFAEEASLHYNQELAFRSLDELINHRTEGLLFYEPKRPDDEKSHVLIAKPSIENLKAVYEMEGLQGLKGYSILVPEYITDDGDIFGTPDISSDGTVNLTHKLIVVQRFSLYDIIKAKFHVADESKHDIYTSMINGMTESHKFYSFVYVIVMILDLIAILVFISFMTKGRKPPDQETT